ncbi:hypothetical protein [Streptomyces montanisoli]|uniref:Uncharacterized protein n=1 Tax=Streptomyces montanisoli TaxID=2798581 RepID=A0A940MBJ4_9ACTN|nr:hypothetical protein [Streptomyces montanisoli]MBP0456995.1 hypothetical protein [Streptomyces montanisoli]
MDLSRLLFRSPRLGVPGPVAAVIEDVAAASLAGAACALAGARRRAHEGTSDPGLDGDEQRPGESGPAAG